MTVKELIEFLKTCPQNYEMRCGWEGTDHGVEEKYFVISHEEKEVALDCEDGYDFANQFWEKKDGDSK